MYAVVNGIWFVGNVVDSAIYLNPSLREFVRSANSWQSKRNCHFG
ncbi:hypothetical protein ACWIUD_02060 [Helicobacter sp. 23-1044]